MIDAQDRLVDLCPSAADAAGSHGWRTEQQHAGLLRLDTARQRVAAFLTMGGGSEAVAQQQTARLRLPMTYGEIADYLGLTVAVVSQTIMQFRMESLIEIVAGGVAILNHYGLQRVALGWA